MRVNYAVLRWFVIFLSSLVTVGLLQSKGLFSALWIADISGLSFVILAVYAILTMFVGVLTHRLTTNDPGSDTFERNIPFLNGCWYGSELLMAIGMMGTLIGFTLMLGPALSGLDPTNLLLAKEAIFKMANGMSTAVLTTLVGLITSQLIKLQLISLETGLDDPDR